MPRNPNKIKTSLFKAVQKQALLWSDGDLIIWGHQECTALHWLNPCHPAQLCKNWTFRLGKQGSAPHTALPLVFTLPSSTFYEIPFVRRTSSQACVCMQRFRVCLQPCKQPQHTGIAVSCTKHPHQWPVCPGSVFHIVAASGSHRKTKETWSKLFFILKMLELLCCLNCSHEQPLSESLHSFIYVLRQWHPVSSGTTGTPTL